MSMLPEDSISDTDNEHRPLRISTPISTPSQHRSNDFDDAYERTIGLTPRRSIHASPLKAIRTFGTEMKQKIYVILLCFVILIILGLLLRKSESPQYKLFASAIGVVCISFYTNWMYILCRMRNLHRIRTRSQKIRDFGNVTFVTEIKEYIQCPVKSISELFASRGSSIQPLVLTMCVCSTAISSSAVMLHWIDVYQHATWVTSWKDPEYLEFYFLPFCCVSTLIIGYFDLNMDDKMSVVMHYTGVVFMLLTGVPYIIISNKSPLSICLFSAALLLFVSWAICANIVPDKYELKYGVDIEEIKRKVHRSSLLCVSLETMGTIIQCISYTLYVWNIQDVRTLAENRTA